MVLATSGESSSSCPPGEPQYVEPEQLEPSIASPVVLERGPGAMRLPTVDLDDEALGGRQRKSTS